MGTLSKKECGGNWLLDDNFGGKLVPLFQTHSQLAEKNCLGSKNVSPKDESRQFVSFPVRDLVLPQEREERLQPLGRNPPIGKKCNASQIFSIFSK